MNLKGWNNPGRNIKPKLHEQFYKMINILDDNNFTKGRNFTQLKNDLSNSLETSDGQLSTIKNVIEDLGLVNRGKLERKNIIFEKKAILTDLGKVLYSLIEIEKEVKNSAQGSIPQQIKNSIEGMYKGFYTEAMIHYYFPEGVRENTKPLHPARAILKQLRKHKSLDYFEYYLLCTHIFEDDNSEQEILFEQDIEKYRTGNITFQKSNIVEQIKGHQFLPQWLEMAELIEIKKGNTVSEWQIIENSETKELIDQILKPDFLDDFYKTMDL